MPYLGASAGTNMACPTLRTTNDSDATATTGGTTWSRLFTRSADPRELPPNSDLTPLLATHPNYDTP